MRTDEHRPAGRPADLIVKSSDIDNQKFLTNSTA